MHPSGVVRQPTAAPAAPERFPFDIEFQRALLRLICEDDALARATVQHLKPAFFEGDVLQWAYAYCQRHYAEYNVMPSLRLLLQHTRTMDPRVRHLYTAAIEQIVQAPTRDDAWLRNSVLDFVKRNIFVRAYGESRELFNSGKVETAYDMMMKEMEKIIRTQWDVVDRSNFFEELTQREHARATYNEATGAITTGWAWLDHLLGGGLSLGEVGVWLAYPKVGKSITLVQHGGAACRFNMRRTLHLVFEGKRPQTETRYDAYFSGELYNELKNGGIRDANVFARLQRDYAMMRGLLVVRGFTDKWTYTVEDIQKELDDLAAQGWDPDLICLDYVDLVSGRSGPYKSEHDKQRDAVRDVKSLANRGYAIWTATQARRPTEEKEAQSHRLLSREIADCYDKVRVVDFIGSLNQTTQEKSCVKPVLRAYAELYRDSTADIEHLMRADYAHMSIREEAGLTTPTPTPGTHTRPQLGAPTTIAPGVYRHGTP